MVYIIINKSFTTNCEGGEFASRNSNFLKFSKKLKQAKINVTKELKETASELKKMLFS